MWRDEPALVARRERIALAEPLGQPDDAELEAAAHLDVRADAARDLDAAAADVHDDRRVARHADAVHRRQVDEPGLFGPGDDARADAGLAARSRCRNSPPFSASRVALVAAAMISSTRCDSARRRNFDSTCSAACIASGVSARPSSPPAPRRTISFSRSMTSKDRSGRTRTTIMCSELVPMSMAAMRMGWRVGGDRRGLPL